jgi:hypothetical protein
VRGNKSSAPCPGTEHTPTPQEPTALARESGGVFFCSWAPMPDLARPASAAPRTRNLPQEVDPAPPTLKPSFTLYSNLPAMSIRPSRAEALVVEPHHRGQAGRVPKNPIPEEPLPRWSPKASRLAARLRPEAMNRWPVLHRGPEGPRLPGPPPRSPRRPLWLGRKARGAGALRSLPSTTVPDLQGNRIRRG